MNWPTEEVTYALEFGATGLSLGVLIGHRVTTWLWQRKVQELKLDWTEELYAPKPRPVGCECGHEERVHYRWPKDSAVVGHCTTCGPRTCGKYRPCMPFMSLCMCGHTRTYHMADAECQETGCECVCFTCQIFVNSHGSSP